MRWFASLVAACGSLPVGVSDERDPRDEKADPEAGAAGEYEVPDFSIDADEDIEEPPLSFWGSISEIGRGLIALLLVSVGVLVLYIAGGIFLGFLTWAAPAVFAVTAALILARYLSRNR
ncbi:MAG: hypothetical protein ACM36C_08635 [Acidobacteriota bacterium]